MSPSKIFDLNQVATFLFSAPAEFTFVRDIEYFEGPLLSEFKTINNDRYIVAWRDVDREAKINRWMVVFTRQGVITRYINKEISMLEMLRKHPTCYFVDTFSGEDINKGKWWVCDMKNVPSQYFPEVDAFYDPDLDPALY